MTRKHRGLGLSIAIIGAFGLAGCDTTIRRDDARGGSGSGDGGAGPGSSSGGGLPSVTTGDAPSETTTGDTTTSGGPPPPPEDSRATARWFGAADGIEFCRMTTLCDPPEGSILLVVDSEGPQCGRLYRTHGQGPYWRFGLVLTPDMQAVGRYDLADIPDVLSTEGFEGSPTETGGNVTSGAGGLRGELEILAIDGLSIQLRLTGVPSEITFFDEDGGRIEVNDEYMTSACP